MKKVHSVMQRLVDLVEPPRFGNRGEQARGSDGNLVGSLPLLLAVAVLVI